jgi:SHS2 domain-containing protein
MAERRVEYQRLSRGKWVGIRVEAPSLQRIYLDIALAFFDHVSTGSRTPPAESMRERLELAGTTSQELLEKWVEGVRGLYRDRKLVAGRALFERFDGKSLVAVLHGAPYASLNHGAFRTIHKTESIKLSMDGPADKMFSAEWLWSE